MQHLQESISASENNYGSALAKYLGRDPKSVSLDILKYILRRF